MASLILGTTTHDTVDRAVIWFVGSTVRNTNQNLEDHVDISWAGCLFESYFTAFRVEVDESSACVKTGRLPLEML